MRTYIQVVRGAIAAVALVALTVGAVGCTADVVDPGQLEGTWVLESFGGTTRLEPADPDVTSTITFDGNGQVSGNSGVNSIGGEYEAKGDGSLTFGPLAMTEMAGPPNAMAQEAEFAEALDRTEHFEFGDGTLVLSDLGNNTLVVLERD